MDFGSLRRQIRRRPLAGLLILFNAGASIWVGFCMRFKQFGRIAAFALVTSAICVPADAGKPARPALSAAKKKAAAAKVEQKRIAAEAAAKAAAEAAEKARVRAQWGLLADIGVGDFETSDGLPLTVRRTGEAVEMTYWTSVARARVTFERDPAANTMTLSAPGQWSRKTFPARVEADGTIEATAKNGSRWTALSRDPTGAFVFAGAPGAKTTFGPIRPYSKAAEKIASLVAAGKVTAVGAAKTTTTVGAPAGAPASSVTTAAALPAASPMSPKEAYARFRALKGYWTNNDMLWLFWAKSDVVSVDNYFDDQPNGKDWVWKLNGDHLYAGNVEVITIPGGIYVPTGKWALKFLDDGTFEIVSGKYKNGAFVATRAKSSTLNDGHYVRKDFDWAMNWVRTVNSRVAQREQQQASGGNSGWLGGLIMGGVAAAAGGDAGMVMGAAMKGVEMTTDNEMTRNVLAGQGDAMIQSSIDTQNQIAETERLRVAAAEETRRKREAEAKAAADARDIKARSDQQARDSEARAQAARAEQDKRDAAVAAEAEKRRADEARRVAELKRKQEEAARPIEMKEGVVLCEKKRDNYYRCDGPLQVTYSDLKSVAGMASIGQACGSDRFRDIGMAGSYRAFGCNFGMNPDGISPGNRDVPAAYGLYVERAIFHCPRSKDAYCTTR